ncbi:unnamed protein product [Ixodes hexagonus]
MTRRSKHTEHDFSELTSFGQTVHPDISGRIRQLVREGTTSVQEVKKCLRYFVDDVIFAGKEKPDDSCRAFHPTTKDVGNHISAALKKQRSSDVDQGNVLALVEVLRSSGTGDNIEFRPYRKQLDLETTEEGNIDDMLEVVAREYEETLLFCYQSRFMEELLVKYFKSVVCLDETNKTTDYALPLFFVVVKTPAGYMVAGVFIVQFETASCIAEPLSVFKRWCPDLDPEYWMVDWCPAEMRAIGEVFPKSAVMLCEFHREQAWDRWLRRKENGVSDREGALSLLRKLAHASSQDSYDHALKDLTNSEH